jgi:hypothetical protein
LRLRKVHHACFTRVAESTVGGLPGVMLTLSDLGGVSNLRLHGPRALHRLLFATRHFVHEYIAFACHCVMSGHFDLMFFAGLALTRCQLTCIR